MNYRKHELVVALKHKGWRGDESRLSKQQVQTMLVDRGLVGSELDRIIRAFRSGNVGAGGEARNAAAGVTQAEVVALVEAAFRKSDAFDLPMNAPAAAALDLNVVRKLVAEEISKASSHKIIIDKQAGTEVKLDELTHPIFEKVLKLVKAGQSVMIKGPAGCGKSYLGEQISRAIKAAYGALHCSAGASESQLIGWLMPGKGGEFSYRPAQFAKMWKAGNGVFLIDEMDRADPNFLMVLNGALANGSLHVPQNLEEPSVKRGKNFHVLAAVNTFGTGADSMYVAAMQLDVSTIDRFYLVEMDYDRTMERKLAERSVSSEIAGNICSWAWNLRDKVAAAKVRRVVSTRIIQRMAASFAAGFPMSEVRADVTIGWTRDELNKVGITS